MKQDYRRILKKELRDLERTLRRETGCTQAQMAERLCMDPRSLAYLENGTCMCGTLTMALLLKQLPSADAFLNELWQKFDAAANDYEIADKEILLI